MRALITLFAAMLVSWAVAYAVEIGLGIALDAHEELIVAMIAQIVFVVVLSAIFGFVLLAGGGARAVTVSAIVVTVVGLLALAGLEAFTLVDEPVALAPSDIPLLVEAGVPALASVIVQWWMIRRYARRRDNERAPLGVQPITE